MVMNVLRSRKFAKRVLLGLLVLIIPAFVLWGVGSITDRPPSIGSIGGKRISVDDFMNSAQGVKAQVLLSYYDNPAIMNRILQNRSLINHMAWERLVLLHSARRNRTRVTDKDVMSFLSQHPIFQKDGTFDMNVYNYMLRNMLSMEPHQFEKITKENLAVKKMRRDILSDIAVSDEELLDAYRAANDKVDLTVLLIGKELFADASETTHEEAEAYYRENKNSFFSPAEVDIEYMEIPIDEDLQKEEFIEKIRNIHADLRKSPEDFGRIAADNGFRYQKTGPFSREDLIPGIKSATAFHDIAFTLEEGQVSQPVVPSPESENVYIIRKLRHLDPVLRGFDEVKEEIRRTIAGDKRLRMAREKAGELYQRIDRENLSLEDAAKGLGVKTSKVSGVDSGGYIEGIGPAKSIVLLALKSGEGKTALPVTVKEKGVVLVSVDKIIPASEEKFTEEKEALRQNLLTRKQMAAMERWFKQEGPEIKLERSLNDL